jgi:hypothetical protein
MNKNNSLQCSKRQTSSQTDNIEMRQVNWLPRAQSDRWFMVGGSLPATPDNLTRAVIIMTFCCDIKARNIKVWHRKNEWFSHDYNVRCGAPSSWYKGERHAVFCYLWFDICGLGKMGKYKIFPLAFYQQRATFKLVLNWISGHAHSRLYTNHYYARHEYVLHAGKTFPLHVVHLVYFYYIFVLINNASAKI